MHFWSLFRHLVNAATVLAVAVRPFLVSRHLGIVATIPTTLVWTPWFWHALMSLYHYSQNDGFAEAAGHLAVAVTELRLWLRHSRI